MVTDKETEKAMTTMRFSWGWHKRLTHGISSLLRNPKPASIRTSAHEGRAKSKRRLAAHSTTLQNDSTPNVTHGPQGSIEKKMKSLRIRPSQPPSDSNVSRLTSRRGSDALSPSRDMHGASCTRPSSGRNSEGTTIVIPSPAGERTRHRFSLSSMKRWRSSPHRTTSQASSPLDTSSVGSSQEKAPQQTVSTDVNITLRRSEEVLRHHRHECMPGGAHGPCEGGLTAARRASSWGEPTNYAEEVTSLTSGEHDGLDEDALFLGAGGVCNDPSTLVSNLSLGFSHCAVSRMRVYRTTTLGSGLLLRLEPVRRRHLKVANLSYDLRRPARVRYIKSHTNLVSRKQVAGKGINIKGGRNRQLYSGLKLIDHIRVTRVTKRVTKRTPRLRSLQMA
ncbi:hypothetical protein EDD15DRAFT_1373760 [Pisolithus albus]|nr:hypothetical protein EDD15DRAFT_1373760 [Pisolithus albus]